jgi:hypothetical protein
MTGRMVLRLSETWAVLADDRQWMLCRRRKNRKSWDAVSFVASTKAVLLRCVHEKDAVVDPEGQAALDALPESFQVWKRQAAEGLATIPAPRLHTGRYARNSLPESLHVPTTPTSRRTAQILPLAVVTDTMDGEPAR